ncbi:peptidylprolyl isomerase [Bradyrhizobium genosp. SA-3]|nr:peptidylprolyl isomerase [Bradyrhizobium genosp. SA-3]
MPDFARYDGSLGYGWMMLRRCVLVFCLAALGLALNGCTRCGPIWDDWLHAPKSCRSDRL